MIDSGIDAHADLSSRLFDPQVFGVGDAYGHGTHVAGISGGSGALSAGKYVGIAPGIDLISLGVSDENGMAYESDVVEALEWVFNNHEQYNIRVVNLSLNSTVEDSYHNSGIDAGIEILWFNGIVVVASVGNKGPAGGYNTANSAPANDPFIIAVGASDEHNSPEYSDDTIVDSADFGTNGRYITRKYPGLFVLVAEMTDVDYFEITGDLGADGGGSADGAILQSHMFGATYYGFVKRVYNAGDPSVNHLIIVADNPSADHTFATYTNDDFHRVSNLTSNRRLYYLLYAGENGFYIDDNATLNIMETFITSLGLSVSSLLRK